jgi:hypothetical protein
MDSCTVKELLSNKERAELSVMMAWARYFEAMEPEFICHVERGEVCLTASMRNHLDMLINSEPDMLSWG